MEYHLTEIIHGTVEKGADYKLYLYGKDGFHGGAVWFTSGTIVWPDEQIGVEMARGLAEKNIAEGFEVRITDGGDFLVFHSNHGQQLYPNDSVAFWEQV